MPKTKQKQNKMFVEVGNDIGPCCVRPTQRKYVNLTVN